jgi:hypothetical protein
LITDGCRVEEAEHEISDRIYRTDKPRLEWFTLVLVVTIWYPARMGAFVAA